MELEKVKIIIEQCQFCLYWHIEQGCVLPGTADNDPVKDCLRYNKQDESNYR